MEMRFFRQNLLLLSLLIVGTFVFSVFGCPYFHDQHHDGICVAVYALIVLAFVYGRAVTVRRRAPTRRPRPD